MELQPRQYRFPNVLIRKVIDEYTWDTYYQAFTQTIAYWYWRHYDEIPTVDDIYQRLYHWRKVCFANSEINLIVL